MSGRQLVDAIWDVVIVGAGPAGAATAITLARFGQRVLLVEERASPSFKLGESLPPTAVGLVRHFLGDLESPEQNLPGLFKTAGNISLWTNDQAEVTDFFFTLTGFGLCVERLAFDAALRSSAMQAGASVFKGVRFESCSRITAPPFNWQVNLSSETGNTQHRARYLVDCSGRRAAVARTLAVQLDHDNDRLFAYAQWFSCAQDDDDRYTRIEAAPQGWWYSNRLPGSKCADSRRLVVLHSDKDLPEARLAARQSGFDQLLGSSIHIGPLLQTKGYRPCGEIRGAPANSQRLGQFCGDAWMAVGDAAQAYDPLSSQGIDKALRTGSHAGHMIHYALTDCPQGAEGLGMRSAYVQQYNEQQHQLWQTYLTQRNHYYRSQPRWPNQPFWQRRR
nr:FAD-dependent monooxygenase [Pollutimonas harenae]